MIYPKFPQRYLAAIVFCLILTLAALGGIFLIYLFNGNATPLLFTSDTSAAGVVKPPNYFYGNTDKYSSYQQNLLNKELQLQRESAETHAIKDKLITLDELVLATSGSISSEQQVLRSMKQQQHATNIRGNYHRMITAASGPVLANSDELSLEHQQAMFSQQHKLQHQPQLLEPSSDMADSIEATAKELSTESDDDDVKLVSALTSIESFQYQIPSSSSENSDTIYIDDFERQGSSGDIHIDETSGSDAIPSDTNVRMWNNFTDVLIVEENDTNSALTTTSSSVTAAAQNSSNINRFIYKMYSKPRNKHRQQLTALVKKKRKQQRMLSKLQHKNSNNNNNVVKLNTDKQLKHQLLQYSTQKVKKHINLQHRDNRISAYDSNSSSSSSSGAINDVNDMIAYSGSGDFNSDDNNDNDDSDDDYDIDEDTANYIKRINIKMWRTISNVASNLNTQRKSKQQHKQHQQQQSRRLQAFSNKQKKHRRFKHKQSMSADSNNVYNKQNARDLQNDVDNFYSISSEIVSNLSTPQLNHEKNALVPMATTSQQDKDKSVRKSNISSSSNNNRINQISAVTTRNTVAITNSSQWLLSPTNSVNNVTSSTSIQINNTSIPQHQLSSRVTDLAAAEPVKSGASGGSAEWLETRTRRIMGNVKKSEERSRQLLLCEEAGGGELCRMLFKGHLNE